MTDINKQKFLAELAKLLTFMYEEDRQLALAMYGEMFDQAENEQLLIQNLISPTRQAVIIARSYNARDRKLQVMAQSREDGEAGESAPEFVQTINQIFETAVPKKEEAPVVDENQFSLFDEPAEELFTTEEPAVEERAEVDAPAAEEGAEAEEPVAEESADAEEPTAEESAEAEEPAEEDMDDVDKFLADFTLPEEVTAEDVPAVEEAASAEEAVDELPVEAEEPAAEEHPDEELYLPTAVREPRVFLLILYIILAIPVCLAGTVLLLIPTLLFLSLAIVTIAVGVFVATAAFSGFAVLADMLLVAGIALVVLAVGLLFLWIFIWFIGGAIVGLFRGVIALGRKWCYKEVAVQ